VRCPELWDGKAAARCVEDLRRRSAVAKLPIAKPSPAELAARYGGGERRKAGGSDYRRAT
jgi:hypothetical protein